MPKLPQLHYINRERYSDAAAELMDRMDTWTGNKREGRLYTRYSGGNNGFELIRPNEKPNSATNEFDVEQFLTDKLKPANELDRELIIVLDRTQVEGKPDSPVAATIQAVKKLIYFLEGETSREIREIAESLKKQLAVAFREKGQLPII